MAFQEIIGQPKAVKLLHRSLDSGRLAHAYLFTGPDGVGKKTAALAMAAYLFCTGRTANEPCTSCPGCKKFTSLNHPDFLHIRPDGAGIKIDQVRELKKRLGFPPLESDLRVILLEDVHTMRREAGNSLLKILEEPPPGNLLLLTADETEQLLPTIVSRCQAIPFHSLSQEQTVEVLMHHKPEMNRTAATSLAIVSDGCPGKAMTVETGVVLDTRKYIVSNLLASGRSEAERTELALALAAGAADLKDDLLLLTSLLRVLFKEAMLCHLQGSPEESGDPDFDQEVRQARERWNLDQLSDMVGAVQYAEQALARNCNRALVCEVLFLRLTR